MKKGKLLCIVLVAVLLLGCAPSGAQQIPAEVYARKMLNYYRLYQNDAQRQIQRQLDQMELSDPVQAKAWGTILESWQWVNEEMELTYGVLPDGLPEDDSLGIVIMGFGLNPDGTIRPELEKRLQVGLASAKKYPNAYVILTGGPTAADDVTTEAGQMARWLRLKGLEEDRIIVENRSLSTAQNAKFVCAIVEQDYPRIRSLAVVTSDYHIARSFMNFSALCDYNTIVHGKPAIGVLAHACSDPGYKTSESLTMQAGDIASVVGLNMVYQRSTTLYAG